MDGLKKKQQQQQKTPKKKNKKKREHITMQSIVLITKWVTEYGNIQDLCYSTHA